MVIVKVMEHNRGEKPCYWRWVFQGQLKDNIVCPSCHRSFSLSDKDKRILNKLIMMNRERG
jgi:hypothetical protein